MALHGDPRRLGEWCCGVADLQAGSALPDISTPVDSNAKANIALLYSPALAADLLEVKETTFAEKLGARCKGWVSSANSNWARRGGWLLFINRKLRLLSANIDSFVRSSG